VFGDVVRAHRRRLGWTQQDLAEKAGLAVRSVRRIEAGRVSAPRPPTVQLLADALDLTGIDRSRFCLAAARMDACHADSGHADSGHADSGQPATAVKPAQLPPDIRWFTGREHHLAFLDLLLTVPPEGAPTAVFVSGTAGVGKTALAVHWAHRVVDEFPDGQMYVNLRGFNSDGRVKTPTEAIRGLLDALGVPAERIPHDLDAQVGLYRSRLVGRRVLIVLDNARDAEQVRPLLPGSGAAFVVVTSRNQLTGLVATEGAHPLTVDLMAPTEARQLLVARLGAAVVAAEPEAADRIVTACARLPLALAIAAGRARQTGFRLAAIADELAHTGQQLDALDTGDPASQVRTVFSWSYADLTSPAARMFRLLGLNPGSDISYAAAASLAGQPPAHVRRLLAELVRANLLIEHVSGRYTIHDLLRVYANELTHQHDHDDDRGAAVIRVRDHYLHTACAAQRLFGPDERDPIRIPLTAPARDARPEHITDAHEARAWFATEYNVVLAAVTHAADTDRDPRAWQIAWAYTMFLAREGLWHDMVRIWQPALSVAHHLGHAGAQAYAHRRLGHAAARHGRLEEVREHLEQAIVLHNQAGETIGTAHAHRELSYLYERQGDLKRALSHSQEALNLYRMAGDKRWLPYALNELGWTHIRLGNYAQGLDDCQRALVLFQKGGVRYGQAAALDSIGHAFHHLGDHDRALVHYRQALGLFQELGQRTEEAETWVRIGESHYAAGDRGGAHKAWQAGLDILSDINHPDADAIRHMLNDLDRNAPDGIHQVSDRSESST